MEVPALPPRLPGDPLPVPRPPVTDLGVDRVATPGQADSVTVGERTGGEGWDLGRGRCLTGTPESLGDGVHHESLLTKSVDAGPVHRARP